MPTTLYEDLPGIGTVTYYRILSLDIGHNKAILIIREQVITRMSSGTHTSSVGKFGTFVVRRFPQLENMPWSHGTKIVLWVGLGAASWAAVVAAGYFLWSAL